MSYSSWWRHWQRRGPMPQVSVVAALQRDCSVDGRATAVCFIVLLCYATTHFYPLLPLPPLPLQATLWGWQRRWRSTCRLRSAQGTGCATCYSHAGELLLQSKHASLPHPQNASAPCSCSFSAAFPPLTTASSFFIALSLLQRRHERGGAE